MQVMCKALFFISLLFIFACADEPREGDRCDNKNEETCGTVCVEVRSDLCQNKDAILWCDGYTWKISKTCWQGEMCTERHGYPECE